MRFLVVVAVIFYAGCVPEVIANPDAGTPRDGGCLRPSHELINFGEVEIGSPQVRRVQIKNLTSTPLEFHALPLFSPFFATLDGEALVAPGEQAAFEVQFAPFDGRLHLDTLEIQAGESCSVSIPVRGLGKGGFVIEPSRLSFGGLDVGEFKILELRIANTRREEVALERVSVVDDQQTVPGYDPPFTLIPPVPTVLRAVSTTVFRVIAQPRLPGQFTSRLVMTGPGLEVPMEVLGGTPRAELSHDTFEIPKMDFTPGARAPSFVERVFMLRNVGAPNGAMPLNLVPPVLRVEHEDGGLADAGFTLNFDTVLLGSQTGFPLGLAAGRETSLVLRYVPNELGSRSFNVMLITNDPQQPEHRVKFSVTALSLPECSWSAPASVTFTAIGDGGSSGVVTFSNTGTTLCVLDDLRVEGVGGFTVLDGGFSQRELAPGESHDVILAGPRPGIAAGWLGFHPLSPNSQRERVLLRAPPP